MLIRALFISALFHFVIFLSADHLERVAPPAVSGPGIGVLEMRIALREKPQVLSPAVTKQGVSDVVPESAVQKSDFVPEKKTKDLNIGRFFRSTVEVANLNHTDASRSPDIKSPELPSASVEELGQYRLNVARSARQFKVYPSLARENGWEGVAHVTVALPFDLGRPVVSLGRSSGHAVLDRQALDMVEQAVSLALMPEGLRGKGLSISVPVEYRLAD
ncbi:MAG: TonB family protein [Azonexaceae bacterium]|nr:TonB family protein [Azonexaceae bacterium]